MRDTSVHIHFARSSLVHAPEKNLDVYALLTKSRIAPQLLGLAEARISARQYADLQTLTMNAMDDEFVGHTPYPVPMGSWVAMCHWLINVRTLKQLIIRLCRFYEILGKGFNPILETKENIVVLRIAPWSKADAYSLYGYELFLFACHRLLCWMTQEKVPIHRIHMPFPKPRHHREYRYLFYGYPAYFDQAECSMSIHKSALNLPIRQNLESLNQMMQHPLYEIIVQDYDHNSWAAQVMKTIHAEPTANKSLPEIAGTLGTNAHTLRRRLADEGMSFIDLKRQVKRDLAIHYLSSTEMSVEQVAFKIGFSEASAFIRAFKQWTGVTPYTYRKDR